MAYVLRRGQAYIRYAFAAAKVIYAYCVAYHYLNEYQLWSTSQLQIKKLPLLQLVLNIPLHCVARTANIREFKPVSSSDYNIDKNPRRSSFRSFIEDTKWHVAQILLSSEQQVFVTLQWSITQLWPPDTLAITLHKLLFYFRYSLFTLILCLAALHGALQLSIVVITLVTNVAYQLRNVFADFWLCECVSSWKTADVWWSTASAPTLSPAHNSVGDCVTRCCFGSVIPV